MGQHRREGPRVGVDAHFTLGLAHEVHIVVGGHPGEHAHLATGQPGGGHPRILQRLPGGLHEHALLRIHGPRFLGADAEEGSVEFVHVVHEPPPAGVHLVGLVQGIALVGLPVEAVLGDFGDEVVAGGQVRPERVQIRRSGEHTGHADDGDVVLEVAGVGSVRSDRAQGRVVIIILAASGLGRGQRLCRGRRQPILPEVASELGGELPGEVRRQGRNVDVLEEHGRVELDAHLALHPRRDFYDVGGGQVAEEAHLQVNVAGGDVERSGDLCKEISGDGACEDLIGDFRRGGGRPVGVCIIGACFRICIGAGVGIGIGASIRGRLKA